MFFGFFVVFKEVVCGKTTDIDSSESESGSEELGYKSEEILGKISQIILLIFTFLCMPRVHIINP